MGIVAMDGSDIDVGALGEAVFSFGVFSGFAGHAAVFQSDVSAG
jgi:hypothetical protein